MDSSRICHSIPLSIKLLDKISLSTIFRRNSEKPIRPIGINITKTITKLALSDRLRNVVVIIAALKNNYISNKTIRYRIITHTYRSLGPWPLECLPAATDALSFATAVQVQYDSPPLCHF